MKKIIIAVAAFIVVLHSLSANQLKQSPKPAKLPYTEQYRILKETFKLDKDELSRTETLEAVAVKFAELFERANVLIAQQSEKISTLEAENFEIKAKLEESEKRITDAESRLEVFGKAFDKIFAWMDKVDDDLYNELSLSYTAIGVKIKKLDEQINGWHNGLGVQIDRLRSAVDANSSAVNANSRNINANSQNIQNLWNSIRKW